eukprot:UN1525
MTFVPDPPLLPSRSERDGRGKRFGDGGTFALLLKQLELQEDGKEVLRILPHACYRHLSAESRRRPAGARPNESEGAELTGQVLCGEVVCNHGDVLDHFE